VSFSSAATITHRAGLVRELLAVKRSLRNGWTVREFKSDVSGHAADREPPAFAFAFE
jgi:hypothetical protein